MFPNTWREWCTITTSIPCIRSSRHGRCGACRTHSPRPSRNWKPFRSSGRRLSWEHFLKAFMRCEHAAKPTSAGGKCELQTHFPLGFLWAEVCGQPYGQVDGESDSETCSKITATKILCRKSSIGSFGASLVQSKGGLKLISPTETTT